MTDLDLAPSVAGLSDVVEGGCLVTTSTIPQIRHTYPDNTLLLTPDPDLIEGSPRAPTEAAQDRQLYAPHTMAVHAGVRGKGSYRPLAVEICNSTNFVFGSTSDIDRFYSGELPYEYGRYGSPTVNGCEERLAALEHAGAALIFSSGMAAFTTTLFSMLRSGDHIIIGDDSYRRSRAFCTDYLKRFGISCTVVSVCDADALKGAISTNTKLIVLELPTNPYLRVVDLGKVAAIAKTKGIRTLVDATFATPFNVRPLEYGIDLVLHSATKYLGGHNDLLCGVVAGSADLLTLIRKERDMLGCVPDADTAWRLERSLKTLALRIDKHNSNALAIARYLEGHPRISKVWYPLLESHPDYEVAKEQLKGGGGVVTFTIAGDCENACQFLDRLKIPLLADSLGGTESLVKHVALMSYYSYSPEERRGFGITDNLIRYSVGIEDERELIADLKGALTV